MRPLYLDRAHIVAAVRHADVPRADEVAALLDRTLKATETRVRTAPRSAQVRSQKIRRGVGLALLSAQRRSGALLLPWLPRMSVDQAANELLAWIAHRGPAEFGLTKVPGLRITKIVVRDSTVRPSEECAQP